MYMINKNKEDDFKNVLWNNAYEGQIVFIKGTHLGKFRAYGPHRIESVGKRKLFNPSKNVIFPQPDECLLIERFNFNPYEKNYAKFVLKNKSEYKWSQFIGRCLLIGVSSDICIDGILAYVFENYHTLTLKEIPNNVEEIKEDMKLYFGIIERISI
jgi:hypothetical protein